MANTIPSTGSEAVAEGIARWRQETASPMGKKPVYLLEGPCAKLRFNHGACEFLRVALRKKTDLRQNVERPIETQQQTTDRVSYFGGVLCQSREPTKGLVHVYRGARKRGPECLPNARRARYPAAYRMGYLAFCGRLDQPSAL